MCKISVVTPVYGSPDSVVPLAERLEDVLRGIVGDSFEIIMVNDGCPKNSWQRIVKASELVEQVRGINLSRNFGQHAAIAAGLRHAQGDHIIVMDCDLQDLPEEIPKLYEPVNQGYDVVLGRRINRKDGLFKRISGKLFQIIYDYLTGFETDHATANFSVISKKVVAAYNEMPEKHRPYSYMIDWLGFKTIKVDISHSERAFGKSSYSLKKLLAFAADNIVCQTNRPLKVSIQVGFFMSLVSFCYAAFLVIRYLVTDYVAPGWTSVMVAMFFLSGMILANLGLLGLYLGKVFDGVKDRPIFVIDEFIGKKPR